MNSDSIANRRRSHAVQELRTWICVTEFFVVVVGSRILHFDLRLDGGPAFPYFTSLPLAWRRDLLRISSSSVLLSPIPLCSRLPVAGAASLSRSAPVSPFLRELLWAYPLLSPNGFRRRIHWDVMGQTGAHGRSQAHHLQVFCSGSDEV
jgi:hypothetical protein